MGVETPSALVVSCWTAGGVKHRLDSRQVGDWGLAR